MMGEIELVVFDMAGTTVAEGGAVYRCLRETLSHAGLEVSAEAVKEVKGMAKNEALRLLVERSEGRDQFLDRLPELHRDFVNRICDFYRTSSSVSEMPGASETFRRLHAAGIMVALNTGFSRDIVDSLLERLGWAESELINATVTSDEVARGRPHADMIQSLMHQLNITDSRRIAKVGDTPVDLLEGKNAGCGLTIGVTKGSSTREELERYPHDHLIGTVADLPELLGI
jgi:phosphonatase-like hydrolase